MPAPTPAATPHAPAGVRIENGHPTVITLANDPDMAYWETDVTPPGVDGGDANDLTNMHNVEWRTFAPRTLKTLTEAGCTVQVAPDTYGLTITVINDPTTVTIHMPGGATLAFYGYARSLTWNPWVEGEPPTGQFAIQPTNRDPSDDTEQDPVITIPVGMMRRVGAKFFDMKGAEGPNPFVKRKSVPAAPKRVSATPKRKATAHGKPTHSIVS